MQKALRNKRRWVKGTKSSLWILINFHWNFRGGKKQTKLSRDRKGANWGTNDCRRTRENFNKQEEKDGRAKEEIYKRKSIPKNRHGTAHQ